MQLEPPTQALSSEVIPQKFHAYFYVGVFIGVVGFAVGLSADFLFTVHFMSWFLKDGFKCPALLAAILAIPIVLVRHMRNQTNPTRGERVEIALQRCVVLCFGAGLTFILIKLFLIVFFRA